MDNITIGDYVKHKYITWQGKLKVVAINFQTYTVQNPASFPTYLYYGKDDLEPWEDTETNISNNNDMYCNCSYTDRNIVNSSIQVQGSVEEKDEFKFCRACKKEAK